MAAGIAHELNQPLTGIANYAWAWCSWVHPRGLPAVPRQGGASQRLVQLMDRQDMKPCTTRSVRRCTERRCSWLA
jgi:hypothetical protein